MAEYDCCKDPAIRRGCGCQAEARYADDETVRAITERHIKRWRVALDRMADDDGPDAA